MDNFYQILELIYKLNKKYPELSFGQLVDFLYNKNVEDIFYLSDEEIIERLTFLVERKDE